MSSVAEQQPPSKKFLDKYVVEIIGITLAVSAHIFLYSFLWEYLKERFGKPLGFLIYAIFLSILVFLILFRFLVRKFVIKPLKAAVREVIKASFEEHIKQAEQLITSSFETMIAKHDDTITPKLVTLIRDFEDKILMIQAKQEQEEKFERMKQKYTHVHFKDLRSTNEFNVAECNTVKVGLIRGVQDCVYAIHQIEEFLSLPMETADDQHYFEENEKALERIRTRHSEATDREEFSIHRVFVISKEALKDHNKAKEIRARIQKHCSAGFDVKLALKESLAEPPTFEFGIYDNEIAFRLSINFPEKKYGDGVVYFNDAVLKDVYRKRFNEIEIQSLTPDEFWERYPISS